MSLGPSIYDAAAAAFRSLPHFPGKWRVAGALSRWLRPLRGGAADAICAMRMRDGARMRWDVRDPAEARAIWTGEWDAAERASLLARLPRDAVVIDVGANVGAWTVPLARHCSAGRIYAFEPVPGNRARLERVLADNALDNVTIIPVALGDRAGDVELWLRASQTGADTGTAAISPAGEGHLTVAMQRLDDRVTSMALTRCDFIKIDVEGAELLVLGGAESTVARFRPLILAEFDAYWMKENGVTAEDGVAWADAHGYAVFNWDLHAAAWVPTRTPCGEATLLAPLSRAPSA